MAIWREYFENAYIACVHYLVNRKLHWTERIFWLIAILASVGGTYYVVSRNLFDYREQKVMYKVDTNYLEWRTPFPSVVICERKFSGMPQKVKRGIIKLIKYYKFNESVVNDDLRSTIGEFAFLRRSDISPLKDYCSKNPCPYGDFLHIMDSLRSKCDELFSYCTYNNKKFDCCTYFRPVQTAFGRCYAFNNFAARNGDERIKVSELDIVRKPDSPEGVLYLEFLYKFLIIHVLGSAELPHVKNENTIFKQTQATTLTDSHQYYYSISIKETVILDDQLNVPLESRECRFPHENYLKYFDFYSKSNCVIECYIMAQKKLCNCVLHTYPTDPSEHCRLDNIWCTNEIADNLPCNCDPDCNSTDIHKVGILEKLAVKFVNAKSIVSFTLDVPAPTLRYLRYSLKSPLTLIVSIGGTIGFFLGFSFLSIAQVVYYFLVRTVVDYLLLKNKQKVEDKEEKMKENFRVSRLKLKLEKVEKDIHKGMKLKLEESKSRSNKKNTKRFWIF